MNNTVRNIVLNKKSPYLLDNVRDIKSIYTLRKVKGNQRYACKVRDDAGAETDIDFVGQNLDTAGMLAWSQRNLVASIPLGVDIGGNGISDGWDYAVQSGMTGIPTIDSGGQKLEILSSTQVMAMYIVSPFITCVAGSIITAQCNSKILNNIKGRIQIDWFNVNTYISSSFGGNITNTDYASKSLTGTAPTNTTRCQILYVGQPNAIGNTGSVWFKDASVTISNQSIYVSKIYDQSGFGNDAVQVNTLYQPRIGNAGIIERDFDATKVNALYPTLASASGVNLVSNGDFSSGASEWSTVYSSVNFATSLNVMSITNTGKVDTSYLITTTAKNAFTGLKLFVRAKVKINTSGLISIGIYGGINGTGSDPIGKIILSPSVGDFVELSGIAEYTSANVGTAYPQIRVVYATTVSSEPAYNAGTTYIISNEVSYNSKAYICVGATTGNLPTNTTYWRLKGSYGKVEHVKEFVCIDVTDLGQPTMYFTRAGDENSNCKYLMTSNFVQGQFNQPNTIISVSKLILTGIPGITSFLRLLDGLLGGRNSVGYSQQFMNYELYAGTSGGYSSPLPTVGNSHIFTSIFNTTNSSFFSDGVNRGTNLNGGDNAMFGLTIGARYDGTHGWNGSISEVVICNSNISNTTRNKIEKSQSKYYSIPITT